MLNARNLAACMRGGRQRRDVALAVVLGLLAGFVTGWNLSLAAVLLAAVLLNIRTRTFLLAWAAGLAGAWSLGGFTYRIGQLLLDSTPLGDCVAALGDSPVVALLDWDRYTLVGGACLALAISLPAARLAARLSRRRCTVEAADSRWLRPLGMVGAAGVLLATGAATSQLASSRVERELLSQLTEANGAPVTSGEFHFSLWTGNLHVDDLQLADPRRLDRDRLRIGRVTVQLRSGDLIRGRLHVDALVLEHLRGDVARRQPAESNELAPPVIEIPSFDDTASGPTTATIELDGYLRHWPALRDRLGACEPWVKGLSGLSACDEDAKMVRRERSDLGRPRPRVFIAKLHAAGLASSWGLGARATLEVTQLSSRSTGLGEPTRIELTAPECRIEISGEMDPRDESGRIALKLHSHGLKLNDLVDPQQIEGLLDVAEGAVRLTGEGWIDGNQLDLPLHVEIDSLDAHLTGQQTMAGISAGIWDDGLRRLGALRTDILLAGSWDSPLVTIDRRRVVEQFKHQLRAAGEHQLVKAIDEQLARPETASMPPVTALAGAVSEGDDDGVCRVTDQDDSAAPRYAYPSTDDEHTEPSVTQPSIDAVAANPQEPVEECMTSCPAIPNEHGPTSINTAIERAAPTTSRDVARSGDPEGDVGMQRRHGSVLEALAISRPPEPVTNERIRVETAEPATADTDLPTVDDDAPSGEVFPGGAEFPAAGSATRESAEAPEDQEPVDEGQHIVVSPPAHDARATASAYNTSSGATLRQVRSSGVRRRPRAAAVAPPAPAPRWTPQSEPEHGTPAETVENRVPRPTDTRYGAKTTRTQPYSEPRKATAWDQDTEDQSDESAETENLFSRWSKGLRNKFARVLPHRGTAVATHDQSVDLDEPTVEVPDDEDPIAESASSEDTKARKPWFKMFRR